jgi:hypothetical protein
MAEILAIRNAQNRLLLAKGGLWDRLLYSPIEAWVTKGSTKNASKIPSIEHAQRPSSK